MIGWRIHHKPETVSTNLDAREGRHGDVYTADFQTAGRGRLDHKWLSPPKTNLMMSVVLSVEGLSPEQVSTLPLVMGLAVCKAIGASTPIKSGVLRGLSPKIKWPNDVLVGGRKVAGILCERHGENVIVGIGINVKKQEFDNEIADTAISLGLDSIDEVRDVVLLEVGKLYEDWFKKGFLTVYGEFEAIDFLKGREVSVRQTDGDLVPLVGRSNGIMPDGSLDVDGTKVYAGEAHVEKL